MGLPQETELNGGCSVGKQRLTVSLQKLLAVLYVLYFMEDFIVYFIRLFLDRPWGLLEMSLKIYVSIPRRMWCGDRALRRQQTCPS